MKVGFIGAGNMAQAMIGGILKNGLFSKEEMIASSATAETAKKVQEQFGIATTQNNREAAQADMVILAVKPVYCREVIEEIREVIREQLVVTIVAGKSLAWLGETFGKKVKLIRTMPNTPALVGQGITAICPGEGVSSQELENVCRLFRCFGKGEVVGEHLMDAVVAVSGSSPAYIFLLIEAMADAAVAEGMGRKQAYEFAAQSVLGSAAMVLETGKHPGELKDMVCSPGGTTIAAVQKLEETGFRSSIMEAMRECAAKSRRL
jgi:pyrroline-5-carboxylate reductase